jgi:hypothetical protein
MPPTDTAPAAAMLGGERDSNISGILLLAAFAGASAAFVLAIRRRAHSKG